MSFYGLKTEQSGLIKMVIIIVIALVALSYLGFDVKEVVESPQTKKNATYVKDIGVMIWQKYLKTPATYVYRAFKEFVFGPIIRNIKERSKAMEESANGG